MTDTHDLLTNELKVYYPDVTDSELNIITNRLVDFFTVGAKAIYETDKSEVIVGEIVKSNKVKHDIFPSRNN